MGKKVVKWESLQTLIGALDSALTSATDTLTSMTQALLDAGNATTAATTAAGLATTKAGLADTAAAAANTAAANAGTRYNIGAQVNGLVGASEIIVLHVPSEPITIPAGFTASVGYCGSTPTAQRVWSAQKNGVEFGTITWDIGSHTPTFAAATEAAFNGTTDRLAVVASATADATLADATVTIRGATG